MKKQRVLIVHNDYHNSLPSTEEIEVKFPAIELTFSHSLHTSLKDINAGRYGVIAMRYPNNARDKALLDKIMQSVLPTPGLILINGKSSEPLEDIDLFDKACVFISDNSDLKNCFISALSTALNCYKINCRLNTLQINVKKAKFAQNVLDKTLYYNHEINNLLTAIIGNIHLIMRTPSKCDPGTIEKLNRIDKSAQKIQDMALKLVEVINAPLQPVFWND